MYKCKECGTEYETKPDYCDCGNDTFYYIEEKQPITLEQKSEIVSRVFYINTEVLYTYSLLIIFSKL